jgi:hypothetical protein
MGSDNRKCQLGLASIGSGFDSANELALDKLLLSPTLVIINVAELLQDEIDSLNLRRVANVIGGRLQSQRSAKHE